MNIVAEALKSWKDGDRKRDLETTGFEWQEKRGLDWFLRAEVLPCSMMNCTRGDLEKLGFVFGGYLDRVFVQARLPKGWKKAVRGSRYCWSALLDRKGRERFVVFYKAASYDRRAQMIVRTRFQVSFEPVNGWTEDYAADCLLPRIACVLDAGERVFQTKRQEEPDAEGVISIPVRRQMESDAETWLQERYPDWRCPFIYWDN